MQNNKGPNASSWLQNVPKLREVLERHRIDMDRRQFSALRNYESLLADKNKPLIQELMNFHKNRRTQYNDVHDEVMRHTAKCVSEYLRHLDPTAWVRNTFANEGDALLAALREPIEKHRIALERLQWATEKAEVYDL